MRLRLIIYGDLNTLTGGYIYDNILVEYLQGQGHRVDITSLPWRNYGRHLLDNRWLKLWSDLATTAYDALLQDELNHPSLLRVNRKLRREANFPIVSIVHQVLCRQPRSRLLNWIYQAVERPYLKSVDAFVFNSNTTRKTVEGLINGMRPSIVACPAGDRLGSLSSSERITARAHDSGPLRLIFVGNLLPHKGLSSLINGLSRLSTEKWHLTVVGSLTMDRTHVRRVKRLIAQKKVGRQVELAGPKDGRELAKCLSQSHVFIMPYSHEGFGMAYLEAMAFALPVIGSSTGAVKEFVNPGQNGFLVEPGDFRSVNECLDRWHHDRKCLIEMSQSALATFHARPRWEDTMESIHGFLTGIARSGRR